MQGKNVVFVSRLICCLLGATALPGYANESELTHGASNKNSAPYQEEKPSEEFWLFMAEFSEDGELIDPEDLAELNRNKQVKVLTSADTQSDDVSRTKKSGESL